MTKKIVFLCAAALFHVMSADAQNLPNNTPPAPADDRLATLKALKIDAGAITLVERAAGPIMIALQPYVDSRTMAGAVALFWIASMTKPMTATAFMLLVDEGRASTPKRLLHLARRGGE